MKTYHWKWQTSEEGKRINIEVQVNKEDDFKKRSLYYWASIYTETIAESEAYIVTFQKTPNNYVHIPTL